MDVCIHTQRDMGTRNISISDEAYSRLAALKGPRESFTDVINRLTGRTSVLELAGALTGKEADELRSKIRELRTGITASLAKASRRMRNP